MRWWLVVMVVVAGAGCGRRSAPATIAASPAERGVMRGLEVWSWVVSDARVARWSRPAQPGDEPRETVKVTDDREDIEGLLGPFEAREGVIEAGARERLREAGLRALTVPVEALDGVEARARLSGPVRRQWLGELSRYTEVYRGPGWDGPRAVGMGSGAAALTAGRLDLVLRTWAMPGNAGPVLWVEMSPRFTGRDGEERMLADAGAAFEMERDMALVLIAESPGKRWNESVDAEADEGRGVGDAAGWMGPEVRAGTAWETMMATAGTSESARVRVVLVLVPRLPERFELIAR
ncbi:MAG: hypothetical protein ACKVW3_13960 [Phycisphaerales bacterium]